MKKKSLKKLKTKLWELVSLFVRTKDAGWAGYVPCYTCGEVKHYTKLDAGHAIGGRNNAVLFDIEIIRPQCKKCNMPPNRGMYYEFGTRLNEENGEGWYEQKKIDANKTVKFTRVDLEDMIKEFELKLKAAREVC